MSRITAPATKLTRTIGSNAASISRQSAITASRSVESNWEHTESQDHASSRHLTTLTPSHRPHIRRGPIPLMQTFNITTTTPYSLKPTSPVRNASSPIDFAVLPSQDHLYPSSSANVSSIRVPLLPDNFSPDRSSPALAPETPDGPVALPQIHVVAANPDNVVSAVSEVEGMDSYGVELGFVHGLESVKVKVVEEGGGMIRDLWKGLVEHVVGEESKLGKVKAARV